LLTKQTKQLEGGALGKGLENKEEFQNRVGSGNE